MRTLDYDQFRAEQNAEPLQLVLGGKTYNLPPSIPAALVLDLHRLHLDASPDADVSVDQAIELSEAVFGGTLMRQILRESGLPLTELPNLLQRVIRMYTGADEPPNRATRRAGPRSRRLKSGR